MEKFAEFIVEWDHLPPGPKNDPALPGPPIDPFAAPWAHSDLFSQAERDRAYEIACSYWNRGEIPPIFTREQLRSVK